MKYIIMCMLMFGCTPDQDKPLNFKFKYQELVTIKDPNNFYPNRCAKVVAWQRLNSDIYYEVCYTEFLTCEVFKESYLIKGCKE